jgi:hypothetical protein
MVTRNDNLPSIKWDIQSSKNWKQHGEHMELEGNKLRI